MNLRYLHGFKGEFSNVLINKNCIYNLDQISFSSLNSILNKSKSSKKSNNSTLFHTYSNKHLNDCSIKSFNKFSIKSNVSLSCYSNFEIQRVLELNSNIQLNNFFNNSSLNNFTKRNYCSNDCYHASRSYTVNANESTLENVPLNEREEIFQKLKERYIKQRESKIQIPDSIDIPILNISYSLKENEKVKTFEDLYQALKKQLPKIQVLAVRVNRDSIRDLSEYINSDVNTVDFVTLDDQDGQMLYWHSSAHLLGCAIEYYYNDGKGGTYAKLCDGPPLKEGGFFYEAFLGNRTILKEDEEVIEKLVLDEANKRSKFERIEVSKEEARYMFRDNKYKQEILDKIPENEVVSLYKSGPFIDLCRGPHIPHTGLIGSVKIRQTSGIYYRGDKNLEVLQRVYAITFPDNKQMKKWEQHIEARLQRDHRLIGAKQKLWMFHGNAPGNPFFLPHGTRIFTRLVDMMRKEYRLRGYDEVITPQTYNKDLWKTSGHWSHYKDDMFLLNEKDQEGEEFMGLKPMNCPGHCLVYSNEAKSYRDLPVRYADFSPLHRNELSGALSGLTRVRRFVQDDAHIFCKRDQVAKEIEDCLQFVKDIYARFNLPLYFKLSTRPEKFMGDITLWNEAEDALKNALDNLHLTWEFNHGDGAFYGPKIDITVKDSLDRFHQCATIQLDFQLPQRFQLKYTNENQNEDRPVMIHRAILGSVERFMAVITEHYGGKWPFWLNPRQIAIVPVSPQWNDYAHDLSKNILKQRSNLYIDILDSDHIRFNKKIREAQVNQYNFILIVGEKEASCQSASVRNREDGEQLGFKSLSELIELFDKKIENYE